MKVLKFLFLTVFIILALMVGALLWFQSYVQSEAFLNRLTARASEVLSTQVHIGKLKFAVLKGFDLQSIRIENPAPHNLENFLTIEEVQMHYAPKMLFEQKLQVKKLLFAKPVINLQYFKDGSSNFPQIRVDSPKDAASDVWPFRMHMLLDRFALESGEFSTRNADNELLFAMRQISIDGNYSYANRLAQAQGELKVEQTVLGNRFTLSDLQSKVSYANGKLTLPDAKGRAYNGDVSGMLEADFQAEQPSFLLKLKLNQAEASLLARDFNKNLNWVNGKITATTHIEGSIHQPKLMTGSGDFEMRGATLQQISALRQVTSLLNVPEIMDTPFATIKGTYKIAEQKINFFNLEATSAVAQIGATGFLSFAGDLDFDVIVAIDPTLSQKIPAEVQTQLAKREDGYSTLSFRVTGTAGNMQTNLKDKVTESVVSSVAEKIVKKMSPEMQEKAASIIQGISDFMRQRATTPTPTPQAKVPDTVTE